MTWINVFSGPIRDLLQLVVYVALHVGSFGQCIGASKFMEVNQIRVRCARQAYEKVYYNATSCLVKKKHMAIAPPDEERYLNAQSSLQPANQTRPPNLTVQLINNDETCPISTLQSSIPCTPCKKSTTSPIHSKLSLLSTQISSSSAKLLKCSGRCKSS